MEQPRKLYIVGFNEDEDSIHNGVNMIKFEFQSVNYPSAEWKLLVCFGEYNWVLSSSGLKSTLETWEGKRVNERHIYPL